MGKELTDLRRAEREELNKKKEEQKENKELTDFKKADREEARKESAKIQSAAEGKKKTDLFRSDREAVSGFGTINEAGKTISAADKVINGLTNTSKKKNLALPENDPSYKLLGEHSLAGTAQKTARTVNKAIDEAEVEEYRNYLSSGEAEKNKGSDVSFFVKFAGGRDWNDALDSLTKEDLTALKKIDTSSLDETQTRLLGEMKESAVKNTALSDAYNRRSEAMESVENVMKRRAEGRKSALDGVSWDKYKEDASFNLTTISALPEGTEGERAVKDYVLNEYMQSEAQALASRYSEDELKEIKAGLWNREEGHNEEQARNKYTQEEAGMSRGGTGYVPQGLKSREEWEEKKEADLKEAREKDKRQNELLQKKYTIIDYARKAQWADKEEKLKNKPDWEEKSVVPDSEGKRVRVTTDTDKAREQLLADLLNVTDPKGLTASELGLPIDGRALGNLSGDEKKVFSYLYRTEDMDALRDYLDAIKSEPYKRRAEEKKKEKEEFTRKHPILSNAQTVLSSAPAGVQGAIDAIVDPITVNITNVNQARDINDPSFDYTRNRETVTETTKKKYNMGTVGSFLYDTGMNVAENLVQTGTAYLISGALGAAGAASALSGKVLSEVPLIMMSGNSYKSAYKDAVERGASGTQAWQMGMASALAEYGTEKISWERLIKIGKSAAKGNIGTVANVITELGKQSGTEGMEEVISNVVGYVADGEIMGEKSQYNIDVSDYMKQGMSRAEAEAAAVKDRFIETGLSFLGGALAGGAHAGINMGVGAVYGKIKNRASKKAEERGSGEKGAESAENAEPNADAESGANSGGAQGIVFTDEQLENGREFGLNAVEAATKENAEKVGEQCAAALEKSAQTAASSEQAQALLAYAEEVREAARAKAGAEENEAVTHTEEEKRVIEEYAAAVDTGLLEFVKNAEANPKDNKAAYKLSDVSDRLAKDIKEKVGIDVSGFENEIRSGNVVHIENRHGSEKGKADKSMTREDIARIQYVIDNYENMEALPEASHEYRDKNQKPAPMVRISKRIDGTYYVAEAVPDTNKRTLEVVTAYKEKAAKTQTKDGKDRPLNVRNASDLAASNEILSQETEEVKNEVKGGDTEKVTYNEKSIEGLKKNIAGEFENVTEWTDEVEERFSDRLSQMETMKDIAAEESREAIESAIDELKKIREDKTETTPEARFKKAVPGADIVTLEALEERYKAEGERALRAAAMNTDEEGDTDNPRFEGSDKARKKKAGKETEEKLNVVKEIRQLKEKGIDVELFETADERRGEAPNGVMIDGKIYINTNAEQPIRKTLGHEMLHLLKTSDEEAYNKVIEIVKSSVEQNAKKRGLSINADKERYFDRYSSVYENWSDDLYWEEKAADIAGDLSEKTKFGKSIIEEAQQSGDKTLLRRIGDALARLWTRIRGVKSGEALSWVGDAKKLYGELVKAYRTMMEAETKGKGEVKFSIERDGEGNAFVRLDNNVLDGVPRKQWTNAVTKWLNKNLKGREFTAESDGDAIKITGKTTHEYRKGGQKYDEKMNLAGNLGEAIEISRKTGSASDSTLENGKLKHGSFAANGWDYREFAFEYKGKRYRAEMNVAKNERGKTLYDVTKIKEVTSSSATQHNAVPDVKPDVTSVNSISNQAGNVNNTEQKNSEKILGDSGERFSISESASGKIYDYAKPFSEQVDDWIEGKIPQYDTLLVGETPKVFREIGFNALPVTINQKHIGYAINGTKSENHNIGAEMLKQLPEALENPVAVMDSQSQKGRVVALLPMTNPKNGSRVIVPIEVDGYGRQNSVRIDSNAVTSVYGRENAVTKLLNGAIESEKEGDGGIYYINKNEAAALLQRVGLQLPDGLFPDNGFNRSIRDEKSNVKLKFEDVTQTQQFKRWFGDWENDPKHASKVVNSDGTPKVVYHGTAEFGFTVFDVSKADDRATLFFTDDPSVASTYSGKEGTRTFENSTADVESMTPEEIADALNSVRDADDEYMGYSYVYYGSSEVNELIRTTNDGIENLRRYLNEIDLSEESEKTKKQVKKLRENIENGRYKEMSIPLYLLIRNSDVFSGSGEDFAQLESNMRLIPNLLEFGENDIIVARDAEGYLFELYSIGDARERLREKHRKGNYEAYLNVRNPLIVAGDGKIWNNIDFAAENKILKTTREIAKYAKEKGNDGVIFTNIMDDGGRNLRIDKTKLSNVYVVFNSNQIKSATDNIGTFDGKNDDIRYSMPENQESVSREDVEAVQSIGRKSVNDFTAEDIKKTERFARQYYREMGVKSPFFRAWFGDWRSEDKTPVYVVTEKGRERGVFKNKDTGWNIQVSGKVFNETKVHQSSNTRSAVSYLDYINGITENAVLLDSYTISGDKAKSPNSVMMHSLYAIADMRDGINLIKMYVEELVDVNSNGTIKRAYQLQNMTKAPVTGVRVQGKSFSSLTNVTSADGYTVADLFELVKQNDKNFNPKHASKVVNADGTPKVVYHGTDSEFTVFDRTKGRSNMDIQGMFFSPYEIEARDYGASVGAYYLNLRNPADALTAYKAFKMYKGQNNAGVNAREQLIKLGYDGVDNEHDEYIAFYPEQIKSATDNIGTFDGKNDDIRYSMSDEIKPRSALALRIERGIINALGVKHLSNDTRIAANDLAIAIENGDKRAEIGFTELLERQIEREAPRDYNLSAEQAAFEERMKNLKGAVYVPKETRQDMKASAVSAIFGVGKWSGQSGIGADVLYDDLKNDGIELREADSVQDKLIAIGEYKSGITEKKTKGTPMYSEEDISEITAKVIKQAKEAQKEKANSEGQHTEEEKRVIEEYAAAVDTGLLEFVKNAEANPKDNKTAYKLNDVSDRLAKDIKEKVGIDVSGYGNEIKNNSIIHIENRHGAESGAADKNMTREDIARMKYVIDNYDTIELLKENSKEFRDKNQKPAPMVRISKRIDGTYYVAEAVPDTNKRTLEVITAYKEKAAENQTRDVQAPLWTVRNASDSAASKDSIAPEDEKVKSNPGKKSLAQRIEEQLVKMTGARGFKEETRETIQAMSKAREAGNSSDYAFLAEMLRGQLRDEARKEVILNGEEKAFRSYIRTAAEREIYVSDEARQGMKASEVSGIFGRKWHGDSSRRAGEKGIGISQVYYEMKELGVPLSEAESDREKLLAIKEMSDRVKEKVKNGEETYTEEDFSNMIRLAVNRAENSAYGDSVPKTESEIKKQSELRKSKQSSAVTDVEERLREATENEKSANRIITEAGKAISDLEKAVRNARRDENYSAMEAAKEAISRANETAIGEWIKHGKKKSVRGIYGDFCVLDSRETEAARKELVASQKAADAASRYIIENKMTKAEVKEAEKLNRGTTDIETLSKKYSEGKTVRNIVELAEIYRDVTLTPQQFKKQAKEAIKTVAKAALEFSDDMKNTNVLTGQLLTWDRVLAHVYNMDSESEEAKVIVGKKGPEYLQKMHESHEKAMDIFVRPIAKNEALRLQWYNEEIEFLKGLGIRKGSKASEYVQKFGEGVISESEIPEDIREKVVRAANAMAERYRAYLKLVNNVKLIDSGSEFKAPPLVITKAEASFIKGTMWAQNDEHAMYIKELSTGGMNVQEIAEKVGVDEAIVEAVLKGKRDFTKEITWEKRKAIINAERVKQALELIKRGNKYDLDKCKIEMDYFPHMETTMDGKSEKIIEKALKLLNESKTVDNLPTAINGKTEDFRPNHKYVANLQQRMGNDTEFDAMEGAERYLRSVSHYLFHTSDITKIRVFENAIREKYGSGGDKHLSNFVDFLRQYGNMLAGKQHIIDRAFQQTAVTRRMAQGNRLLLKRVSKNQISYNLGTAISNAGVFGQTLQFAGKEMMYDIAAGDWKSALEDFTSMRFILFRYGKMKNSDYIKKSPFLVNRFTDEESLKGSKLSETLKVIDKVGYFPQGAIDRAAVVSFHKVANAIYQNRGMSEEAAIERADEEVRRYVASRSYGETPMVFNAKAFGILTKYQLEPANQLSNMRRDVTRRNIEEIVKRGAKGQGYRFVPVVGKLADFITLILLFHFGSEFFKKIKGTPLYTDFAEMAVDVANGIMDGNDLVETIADVAEEIPIVNNIQKAANGEMADLIGIGAVVNLVQALSVLLGNIGSDEDEDDDKDVDWSEILWNAVTLFNPFGGAAQARKTAQAWELLSDGYSENKSGKVRYAVDNKSAWNWVFGTLFGKSAMPEVQEWYNDNYSTLSKSASEAFKSVFDNYEMKPTEVFDMMKEYDRLCEEEEKYSPYRFITEEADKYGKFDDYDKYYIWNALSGREVPVAEAAETAEKKIAEMFVGSGEKDLLIQSIGEDFTADGMKYYLNEEQQEAAQSEYERILFKEISRFYLGQEKEELTDEGWCDAIRAAKKNAIEETQKSIIENGAYESSTQSDKNESFDAYAEVAGKESWSTEQKFWAYTYLTDRDYLEIEQDTKLTGGQKVLAETFFEEGDESLLPVKKSKTFSVDKKEYHLNEAQHKKFQQYYNEAFYEILSPYADEPYDKRKGVIENIKANKSGFSATDVAKSKMLAEYEDLEYVEK